MATAMARSGWQRWVALVAAYLFAIQTVLVVVAPGVNAGAANPLHVLCYGAGSSAPDIQDNPQAPHETCCSLACSMFGSVLAPPGEAALPLIVSAVSAAPSLSWNDVRIDAHGWTPGNPRAPPLAA
jgi:hypothetical protein